MYSHILVPVSFDDDRDAAGAIDVATLLAEGQAKLTILHVMEAIPAYAISYLTDEYISETRAAIEQDLKDMAAPVANASGVVVSGHSGRTIVDHANSAGVDCIVIAGHRPGMQDILLGSTAQFVVRHAPCAVHVVR